jgi:hypothetical protein
MAADMKKEIKEIAGIARACPEEFRTECFRVLLDDLLKRNRGEEDKREEDEGNGKRQKHNGGHSAFKDFLKKYAVPGDAIGNVFDFKGEDDFLRVSDFRQNTKSKQQIVIGLLACVRGLHKKGIPTVTDKDFRDICDKHEVYDKNNFAKHMNTYKKYFIPAGDDWKLTTVGLQKAADVIKSLGGEGGEFKL